jgi:hypothetical protein
VKRFAKIGGEMVSLTAAEDLASAVWPDGRHAVISMPDKKKGEKLVLVTDRQDAAVTSLVAHAQSIGAPELAVPRKILKVRRCRAGQRQDRLCRHPADGRSCEPFNLRKHRCFDQAFNNGMTEGELVTVDLARVRLIPFITTTTDAVLAIRAPGVTYMNCADRLRELGLPIENIRMREAARNSCVQPAR